MSHDDRVCSSTPTGSRCASSTWTRAMTDLFLGKVEVIEYSRDRTIKGVSTRVAHAGGGAGAAPVPARPAGHPLLARQHLHARRVHLPVLRPATGHRGPDVRPRRAARGRRQDHVGEHRDLLRAVQPTPRRTARRSRRAWRLRRRPTKPRYLPAVTVRMDRRHVPEEWRPYWNVTLEQLTNRRRAGRAPGSVPEARVDERRPSKAEAAGSNPAGDDPGMQSRGRSSVAEQLQTPSPTFVRRAANRR